MPALNPAHYALSPADVTILRADLRKRVPDIGAPSVGPMIRYNAGTDTYELIEHGGVICHTQRLEVVAALLRAERFEPGFIRRVLTADTPPDEALLDADAREKRRRERANAATAARKAAEDAEEARRAVAAPKKAVPSDLSLDDLL